MKRVRYFHPRKSIFTICYYSFYTSNNYKIMDKLFETKQHFQLTKILTIKHRRLLDKRLPGKRGTRK